MSIEYELIAPVPTQTIRVAKSAFPNEHFVDSAYVDAQLLIQAQEQDIALSDQVVLT